MENIEEQIDVESPIASRAAASSGLPASQPLALVLPSYFGPHQLSPPEITARTARSRPTNNQLLYKAYFRWGHYQFKLQPGLVLPDETEACASVTSAFLQVLNTLFFVETRQIETPRNILHLLSLNTRRTKVVELSSGTHRVPEELRRHSLSDGSGGSYSTNLDRNRYGNDDQYLSTVIRYDLEFLDLCPCMVDVEIIDAKNGQGSILVSADPDMCNCSGVGSGAPLGIPHHSHAFNAGRQIQHTTPAMPGQLLTHSSGITVSDNGGDATHGGGGIEMPPPIQSGPQGAVRQDSSSGNSQPKQTVGNGNRELFSALLNIAATDRPAAPCGLSSSSAASRGCGGGETRCPRSRLHHLTGASDQRFSKNQALLGSAMGVDERGVTVCSPCAGASPGMVDDKECREQTAETGHRQHPHSFSEQRMGNGSEIAPGGVRDSLPVVTTTTLGGHNRDQELRRLQDDFRGLKEESRLLEAQLDAARRREATALAATVEARTEARHAREEAKNLRTQLERNQSLTRHNYEPGAIVRIAVQTQGTADNVCDIKTTMLSSPGGSSAQAMLPIKRKADCVDDGTADLKRHTPTSSSDALTNSLQLAQVTA